MTRPNRRILVATAIPLVIAAVVGCLIWPRSAPPPSGPPSLRGPRLPPGSVEPALSVGWSFGTLLAPDGELWLWGHLPFTTPNSRPSHHLPFRATPGMRWSRMAGSGQHALLIRDDGTLWGLGGNFNGQLGLPTQGWFAPSAISSDADWTAVATTDNSSLALKKDGTLWYAGGGMPLGIPRAPAPASPASSAAGAGMQPLGPAESRWAGLQSNGFIALAVRRDGQAFLIQPTMARPTLASVPGGTNATWTCLKAGPGGTIVGIDTAGRLVTTSLPGLPPLPMARTPSGIPGFHFVPGAEDSRWTQVIPTANGVLARRDDGSWWGLDVNQFGQLGLGDRRRRTSLTRLAWPADTTAIASSLNTTAALLADGSLWYAGMKLGTTWSVPRSPGEKVHSVVSGLGSALGMPGARNHNMPSSNHPEYLWTWPGPAAPPP